MELYGTLFVRLSFGVHLLGFRSVVMVVAQQQSYPQAVFARGLS